RRRSAGCRSSTPASDLPLARVQVRAPRAPARCLPPLAHPDVRRPLLSTGRRRAAQPSRAARCPTCAVVTPLRPDEDEGMRSRKIRIGWSLRFALAPALAAVLAAGARPAAAAAAQDAETACTCADLLAA